MEKEKDMVKDNYEYSTDEVLRTMGNAENNAWGGTSSDKTSYHFVSNNGHQIDIHGHVIESSYEYYNPVCAIYEDGELLFDEEATNIAPYKNVTYKMGRFGSEREVIEYIENEYSNCSFKEVDTAAPVVPHEYEVPTLESINAKKRQRVVYRDEGIQEIEKKVKDENGKEGVQKNKYHKVVFAFACDDGNKDIANPYMINRKLKDGSVEHSVYLSDTLYSNLKSCGNTTGLDNSKWTGVVEGCVVDHASNNDKHGQTIGLTKSYIQDHLLAYTDKPFDEAAHNASVKKALAKRYQKAENSVSDVKAVEQNMDIRS